MSAEQTRPSISSPVNLAPAVPQYTNALAFHVAANTVLNSSFASSQYNSTRRNTKQGAYIESASSASRSTPVSAVPQASPSSYPYRGYGGDDGFPSMRGSQFDLKPTIDNSFNFTTTDQSFLVSEFRAVFTARVASSSAARLMKGNDIPVAHHTEPKSNGIDHTSRGYWAPPSVPATRYPAYLQPSQSDLSRQLASASSSPLTALSEPGSAYYPPAQPANRTPASDVNAETNRWQGPLSRASYSEAKHDAPIDPVFTQHPYMRNMRLSHSPPGERTPVQSEHQTDHPLVPRPTPGPTPFQPPHLCNTYINAQSSFSSPTAGVQRPAAPGHVHRLSQSDCHHPSIPPSTPISLRFQANLTGSTRRESIYSMNHVPVHQASSGDYIISTGGDPNGGGASIYDNIGGSGSGSGSNNGGNDNQNGHDPGRGPDGGGMGEYGGSDEGGNEEGDGGDEEERRRKKLTLACHFCRRRKLKSVTLSIRLVRLV